MHGSETPKVLAAEAVLSAAPLPVQCPRFRSGATQGRAAGALDLQEPLGDRLLTWAPGSQFRSQGDDACILLALVSCLLLQARITSTRYRGCRISKKGCQPGRLGFGNVLNILPLVWCFCTLESCHLTEACCKELCSALLVNQRPMHPCLANNHLGDGGVKLLCEGLSYPDCQLQNLV